MAFPTVPTAAASRLLAVNQANTTATRTFPDLSSLTKNSGDLLIAIVVAYQTSTGSNAAFSGWTGGFTEFHDSATSTTLAIGCAYKWSDGTETGTFAVTQAATITGHASLIVMAIPGAHATTPPEAGGRASGTTSAANPASFNPSGWDVEDTLWIAVGGSGETATTGSYTGLASAPTNFTNYFDTGMTADAVGAVEGAVSFRQQAAASQDVSAYSVDVSDARSAGLVIAVRTIPLKASDIVEDFTTPTYSWGGLNADNVIAAGDLRMKYHLTYDTVPSPDLCDLTSSSVYAEVTHSTAHASNEIFVAFGPTGGVFDTVSGFQLIISSGTLIPRERTGATTFTDGTSVTYDPVTMKYLGFRHDGTNIHWEYGASLGGGKTSIRSKVPAVAPTAGFIKFSAGNFTADQASVAIFDNVNVAGASPTSFLPASPIRTYLPLLVR